MKTRRRFLRAGPLPSAPSRQPVHPRTTAMSPSEQRVIWGEILRNASSLSLTATFRLLFVGNSLGLLRLCLRDLRLFVG
jgi:hypothetical protein